MVARSPDDSFETRLRQAGFHRIAGVDEVGRGPLCGPVTAAAVILDPAAIPEGLRDSKTLSAPRRRVLHAALMGCAEVSIAHADVEEIDRLNILQASLLAMRRAIVGLRRPPCHALIDGNRLPPGLPCPAEGVVKGDARCLSIAAASIVAKVARDAIMADMARQYPGYGWESNAGYPTKRHINAIAELGVTPFHRRSFKPIRNILCKEH
ncbi:ribonuclease HII [Rhodobacteraceae bacterium 2376]|uniref:Ribonuclease HII n=1 Tax=Rhabdonatronobacter sediminivivens TaxID=2743469 RepID=A0A7Z0HY76_9RHOB|nr:ribonuclease HII [Rhabdonatronobacter sediminivivens]NYS24496.1 ribonuclease HII [Rhabdonatronobacter sediminivivens]